MEGIESGGAKEPIVIIDDDKSIGKTLKLHFERQGFEVYTAMTAVDGMSRLDQLSSAIVVLDVRLPDANGVELLQEIRDKGDNYYSIIITAYPNMESTVKAVQNGVGDYIHKPLDIEEMNGAISNATDFFKNKAHDTSSFVSVPDDMDAANQFIGKSYVMKEVFKTVGMVSMSKTTVHITGESGTGKELVANSIHLNSESKSEPFIPVNCSAIVGTLLESELFGHEKGSFTGAVTQKEGKFAQAGSGTIFLDEIGEMDFNLQAKLLRVLQEREFERVGGKEKLKCECRIISATNKDLLESIRLGQFREDLYFRLNVISIHIPPLRERKEDIPDLALYFIAKANKETGRSVKYISEDALDFLAEHPWKGNVRQLENFITQTVIMSRGEQLTEKTLRSMTHPEHMNIDEEIADSMGLSPQALDRYQPRTLADVEKEQVAKALAHTKWHKGKACDVLGITRPRLDRKIKKYGIKPMHYYLMDDQT